MHQSKKICDVLMKIQYNLIVMLSLGSTETDRLISEPCYEVIHYINNRKIIIWETWLCYTENRVIIVFPLATFTMVPRHALSPAPCPFSESTFCALHFGKKFVKIGQKIRKLQNFCWKSAEINLAKFYHDFHSC